MLTTIDHPKLRLPERRVYTQIALPEAPPQERRVPVGLHERHLEIFPGWGPRV